MEPSDGVPVIDIPDFTAMSDDDLHGWEFRVYEAIPDERELHEIIGVEKTREYYNERGRRLDVAESDEIAAEIDVLQAALRAAQARLLLGKSGRHHFPQAGVWP